MIFHPDLKPPYYACIFPNIQSEDVRGYSEMASMMDGLAKQQEGYLGIDSTRNEDGFGITVSYWRTEQSMLDWKKQVDHHGAQWLGRERWYKDYHVHIAKVEREYSLANSNFKSEEE